MLLTKSTIIFASTTVVAWYFSSVALSDSSLEFFNTELDDDVFALTSIEVGPDRNLYATAANGDVYRWELDTITGRPVGARELLYTHGGPTIMTGLAFDPSATAENLVVWTSQRAGFAGGGAFPRGFFGEITRVELPSVGDSSPVTSQDYITGLPTHFHQNNDIAFAPDGKLYITAGALGAAGGDNQPDFGPETPLSAAILEADVNAPGFLEGNSPVNVNTDLGYDPFTIDAKVTIYGEGVRNAYDVVWHSNGNLYAGVNGNDTNSTLPDDPDTAFDESTVDPGRPDETFINVKCQKYYGHPNPSTGTYISYAGNPTAGDDGDWENPNYPIGTQPESGWDESFIHNILTDAGSGSLSPNGIAEYTFASDLQDRILLAFYAGGNQQIAVIEVDPTSGMSADVVRVDTLTDQNGADLNVKAPLDVAVDPFSGRIYVASHDSPGGSASASPTAGSLFVLDPVDRDTLTGVVGDVNQDGILDEADFDDFVSGWLSITEGLNAVDRTKLGDLNLSGETDLSDAFILRQEFLVSGIEAFDFGLLLGEPVPEPASASVLMIGLLCLIAQHSRVACICSKI